MIDKNYRTAMKILKLVVILGWVTVGFGVIAMIAGLGSASAASIYGSPAFATIMLALAPGLGVALAGMIQVAIGYVGTAILDQADQTRAILRLLQEQVRGGTEAAARVDVTEPAASEKPAENFPAGPDADGPRTYKGAEIRAVGNKYEVKGMTFSTLGKAKRHIDAQT